MIVKAVIAYDGSGYGGFQKQINATGIQSLLEKALEKIHKEPTPVTASGRTDAGVHALGQVIHFEGKEKISMNGYVQAMNANLPKDIRVLSCQIMPDDFHARFSARAKHYDYIYTRKKNDPFSWRYKSPVGWPDWIDIEKMRAAARIMEGEHDFTSFCNAQIHPDKPRVKTIYSIDIREEGEDIRISYVGNGFLRYQVRMMSAVLLAAGKGQIEPDGVKWILDQKDKHAMRWNAPAQGLYLMQVDYDEKFNEAGS